MSFHGFIHVALILFSIVFGIILLKYYVPKLYKEGRYNEAFFMIYAGFTLIVFGLFFASIMLLT